MDCSTCGSPTVAFAIPKSERTYAPEGSSAAAICTRCLAVDAATEPAADPDFSRVSTAFPSTSAQAIPLALAIGRCDSLAMNRGEIESLLRRVERAGGDPLLILDRLLADPSLEPAIDLERRRHQLEQLLY